MAFAGSVICFVLPAIRWVSYLIWTPAGPSPSLSNSWIISCGLVIAATCLPPPNLDPNRADSPEFRPENQPPPAPPTRNQVENTTPAPSNNDAAFIISLDRAMDSHDWQSIIAYTSGSINYFGRTHSTNAYIQGDMIGDSNNYRWVHSTVYPNTFTRKVSNEYSPKWYGPMIYDSITVYTEALENNGRLHRANARLTLGFTARGESTTIYALVLKVL
jgi:hypothetical protein